MYFLKSSYGDHVLCWAVPGKVTEGLSPGSSSCVTSGQSPTISELLEHGMVKKAETLEADRLESETGLGPWETWACRISQSLSLLLKKRRLVTGVRISVNAWKARAQS